MLVMHEAGTTSVNLFQGDHTGTNDIIYLVFLGVYGAWIVTYFSVFKLWFTLRPSASAVAPEPPIPLPSRLWK